MRSTPATMDASSVTSMAKVSTPRAARPAMRSTRRATACTVHPDSARWTAMDSPMPEDAPVTRATLVIPPPYAASPGTTSRGHRTWPPDGWGGGCRVGSAHPGLGVLGDPGVLPVDEVGGGEVVSDGGEQPDVDRLVALGDGGLDGRHDRPGVPLGHGGGELALERLVEDAAVRLGPSSDLHREPFGL